MEFKVHNGGAKPKRRALTRAEVTVRAIKLHIWDLCVALAAQEQARASLKALPAPTRAQHAGRVARLASTARHAAWLTQVRPVPKGLGDKARGYTALAAYWDKIAALLEGTPEPRLITQYATAVVEAGVARALLAEVLVNEKAAAL